MNNPSAIRPPTLLNTLLGSWVIASWIATLALIAAISVAVDASVSTTVLLLVLGVTPAIVIAVLAGSAPSPTVAEILYRVHTKNGRSKGGA